MKDFTPGSKNSAAGVFRRTRRPSEWQRRQVGEDSGQRIVTRTLLRVARRKNIDSRLNGRPSPTPSSSPQLSRPERGDLREWPFLVRQFAISYAPSASVLAHLQNEPHAIAPKSFIAFGDPKYEPAAAGAIAPTLRTMSASGRLNFQPLPYSHTEIDGIAQLFAKDDRELFFREAATEENVKVPERLSSYRMVHFSTHGYVNEARPRFSGLVLSLSPNAVLENTNPQAEDGLLAAYEIFNLKLKADLVVLSACETGLGKEMKGEGLMSLTRAFMYAGTPSVVVSLWNVNDESAADLMIRFYRHLQAGKTKSEALRQAQLETIRDNGFPFFWAPFVLIGKP